MKLYGMGKDMKGKDISKYEKSRQNIEMSIAFLEPLRNRILNAGHHGGKVYAPGHDGYIPSVKIEAFFPEALIQKKEYLHIRE